LDKPKHAMKQPISIGKRKRTVRNVVDKVAYNETKLLTQRMTCMPPRERSERKTCDKFKSRLAPNNFENSNVRLLMMIVGTRVFFFF